MKAPRTHHHRGKRRHHHPDALLGVDRTNRHTLAGRGVCAMGGVLFFLSLPWASLLVSHLLLGPDRTSRWLHGIGAAWLIPGFM
ncbi:MAG: hypothetical protein H7A45_19005 [Verrucomicrobiales bacterium]|nr:hypothetical protein [Verrucomicrobiales bacterium]